MHKREKILILFSVISAIASLVIGMARTATVSELPEKKLDYERLANLLHFGALKKADRQTYRMMLIALNKEPKTLGEVVPITERDIAHFPCKELEKLDQTWHRQTQGKYSFSIQRKIWRENHLHQNLTGSKKTENSEIFAQKVNWKISQSCKQYNELTFNLKAIPGHLPAAISGGFILTLNPNSKFKISPLAEEKLTANKNCTANISAAIFTRMEVCQLPDLTAPDPLKKD